MDKYMLKYAKITQNASKIGGGKSLLERLALREKNGDTGAFDKGLNMISKGKIITKPEVEISINPKVNIRTNPEVKISTLPESLNMNNGI